MRARGPIKLRLHFYVRFNKLRSVSLRKQASWVKLNKGLNFERLTNKGIKRRFERGWNIYKKRMTRIKEQEYRMSWFSEKRGRAYWFTTEIPNKLMNRFNSERDYCNVCFNFFIKGKLEKIPLSKDKCFGCWLQNPSFASIKTYGKKMARAERLNEFIRIDSYKKKRLLKHKTIKGILNEKDFFEEI